MNLSRKIVIFVCLMITALLSSNVSVAQTFTGKIGKTFSESTIGSEPEPTLPQKAPNVIFWMIDDMGFGQLSSYGGLVNTPNLDRLAANGLKFTNYHTTPICSSSRAAMLTGRNSHNVHIGGHSAMAINFPGHDGRVPRPAGTIANNLGAAGYMTLAIGKWDHLPPNDASPAGPFTYWPSGQGFDRFYGFLSFDIDNFDPVLWSDHQPISLNRDPSYHLTTDMADRAINWINMRDTADKKRPFFLYWATGAVHSPHHAPKEYLDRYRGKFDEGWDVARERTIKRQKKLGLIPESTQLPPRPADMQAWKDLSPEQQKMYARAMEAFAAQLSHADDQFGRILQDLENRGELNNTLIIVASDNGASAEGAPNGTVNEGLMSNGILATNEQNLRFYDKWGGPETYPHYPFGWAVAGNTPFRYYKQTAYEGGVRVPLIVSWPDGIKAKGELRNQFVDVIDVTPTILDLARVEPAKMVNNVQQMPFDGKSIAGILADGSKPSPHSSRYFEMYGNRGVWHDGWKAVVPHRAKAWDFSTPPPINDDHWELYDLHNDVNELHDLAKSNPKKLAQMKSLFDLEAKKNHVYPLTNTGEAQRVILAKFNKTLAEHDGVWRYQEPISRIPEVNGPPIHTHSYHVTADLRLGNQANGAIMARGGAFGGMSLYLLNGVPKFTLKNLELTTFSLSGTDPIPAGKVTIGLDFVREKSGATVTLSVDGKAVSSGKSRASLPVWILSNSETLDVGSDTGSAVSEDYADKGDFELEGQIREVVFKVDK